MSLTLDWLMDAVRTPRGSELRAQAATLYLSRSEYMVFQIDGVNLPVGAIEVTLRSAHAAS